MVRAVVEVSGCCSRYRAQIVVKPAPDEVISVDALGVSAMVAYNKLLKLVAGLNIEGLDAASIQPRRWPERERKPVPKEAPAPEASPVPARTAKGTSKKKPASGDGEGDDNIKEGGDEDLQDDSPKDESPS